MATQTPASQETWRPRYDIAREVGLSEQQLSYLARTNGLRTKSNPRDRRQKLLCVEDVRRVLQEERK